MQNLLKNLQILLHESFVFWKFGVPWPGCACSRLLGGCYLHTMIYEWDMNSTMAMQRRLLCCKWPGNLPCGRSANCTHRQRHPTLLQIFLVSQCHGKCALDGRAKCFHATRNYCRSKTWSTLPCEDAFRRCSWSDLWIGPCWFEPIASRSIPLRKGELAYILGVGWEFM